MIKSKYLMLTFIGGIILGAGMSFFAGKADLIAQDKTIANLEEKLKSMSAAPAVPVVTIDALGICSVSQGGKNYMLIDVTNELRGLDEIDVSYRATEQEIEEDKKHLKEQ